MKHIDKDPTENSNIEEEDIDDIEIIDITPTPKQIPYTTESTTFEDEGFEDVEITTPVSNKESNDIIDADDIDMEVTAPTEEKQAKDIGEHFGLDTNFDPKLELSSYKLPPLDLLKDYGETTSSVDKEELEEHKDS